MQDASRVVVVTGAGGGFGRTLVRGFLDEGSRVVAIEKNKAGLDALTADMAAGEALMPLCEDITDEARCRAMADQIKDRWGRVDVLVNNAGHFPLSDFDDISYADWQAVMRVNLDAVFLMTQAMLPLIKGRERGRIVNVGSGSVFRGVARQAHYVAAKSGVMGFTRSLARALGPEGITVNIVAPGLTPTATAIAGFGAEQIASRTVERSIPRAMEPRDLTGAVLFLASAGADFITGQTIVVDGGLQMH